MFLQIMKLQLKFYKEKKINLIRSIHLGANITEKPEN